MPRFGLIGHPVSHSKSPELFRKAYGGKWEYDLIEGADFEASWAVFIDRYDGINITAPFKELALHKADILSPECMKTGATNLVVKTPEGIKAYNSDYLAVMEILRPLRGDCSSLAVIGFGGAGKAALAAAEELGFQTSLYRHNGIKDGVQADIVIYTLPRAVEGTDRISCRYLLEANYLDPVLKGHEGYIPGEEWLMAQARCGYALLTGETPEL